MTVRLLAALGQYPANAIVTFASAVETSLVAGNLAATDLTGGVVYQAPVAPARPGEAVRWMVDEAGNPVDLDLPGAGGRGGAATVVGAGTPSGQAVGAPALLTVTGTTDWQYFEVADFVKLALQQGDSVVVESIWTYTSSLNGKTISLAFGPSSASVTQIAASTRSVSGEVTFVMRAEFWAESLTSIIAHTSLLTPFSNSSNALGAFSIDLRANPMKLFLRAFLANTSETIQLRTARTTINRAK